MYTNRWSAGKRNSLPGRCGRSGTAPVVVVCSAVGEYHAIRGICPHQGALLGRGHLWSLTVSEEPGVYGLAEKAEILRCPWHSFDYDVKTGRCVSDPGCASGRTRSPWKTGASSLT
ncbi:MAG TPA: Rieske (2Fe-2S) protein [Rubrobacter sp.]|nr:Rieske (2Fe-2S) protein [Rubrobacter sp.]